MRSRSWRVFSGVRPGGARPLMVIAMVISRTAALAIVAVVLVAFGAFVAVRYASSSSTGSAISCTTVNALGFDGKNGLVLPILACAVPCPQPGVYISTGSTYGIPFQQAVRSALSAYSHIHGDLSRCILLSVKSPDLLTGESVGLAAYLAIWGALNGVDLSGYAATGVVNPDGSVSGVLYVPQKISAADGQGLRVFVPATNCPVAKSDNVICVDSVSAAERALHSSSPSG